MSSISIPIVETTDEVIHSETNLPSDQVQTSLTWRINAVKGALVQPDFHLNVLLKVYKKVAGKQENVGVADKVCLTNYPLASLFSSAKVEFRNQAVNDFNSQFAYVGFLRALTDFDKDGRESLLGSSLWVQDTPGAHDEFGHSHKKTPFGDRSTPMLYGRTVDLYGPLLLDICRTDLPFPDDVEITLTLNRAPVEFSLNGQEPASGTTYHITIIKADLCVTRARMAPAMGIYDLLGTPVISYPFKYYETQTVVIPKGVANASEDILNNVPPARVVIGMVDQRAYNGTINKNPYNFLSNFIASVFLRKDQVRSIPSEPYTTAYLRVYASIPPDADIAEMNRINDEKKKEKAAEKEAEKKERAEEEDENANTGQKRDRRDVRFHDDPSLRKHRRKHHRAYLENEYDDARRRRMRDPQNPAPAPHPAPKPAPTPAPTPAPSATQPAKPADPPKFLYARLMEFSRLYYESLRVLNSTGGPLNRINQNISMEAFERGYCLMVFDMREDRSKSSISRALQQNTTASTVIRFEARFHEPLAQPTVLICFLEYPRALHIPKASSGLPITVSR